MQVPFLDLRMQYESIRDEIEEAVQQVLNSCAFAGGPFVAQFENDFSSFCGCKHAIGVGSGTEALWLALLAMGAGPDDEVITVPNTFIATTEAISFCGARPVLIDINEQTCNLDPSLLEAAITPRTKAIIPVHLYGQMADMDPIMEIAKKHGLFVIEDACQAHGAEYKGRPAGSIGDAACFSFYPGKNLGAYGEAGAVVTNNPDLDQKIRVLRDHGQSEKYHHAVIGWNGRMDGLQGAVLTVKLKRLKTWNELRRSNAKSYNELLLDVDGVILPTEADYARHVYHVYSIRTQKRDAMMRFLAEKGINCGIHYPVPINRQKAYALTEVGQGSFPVAEKCAREQISLPMFPELLLEQIEFVVESLKLFLSK